MLAGREIISSLLHEQQLDAVIITNPVNLRYLSGFSGSAATLLIGLEKAYLLTDFRYTEQAAQEAPGFIIVRWKENQIKELALLVTEAGWQRVGFEAKQIPYATYFQYGEALSAELVPLSETAEGARKLKTQNELVTLKRGANKLDQAFDYICSVIEPGMSELEIELELEMYLRRQGAEGISFRFIVASGARGALPHGTATNKIVQPGEMITLDFGAIFDGYATDITRTIALSAANQRQQEIHSLVLAAQKEARRGLRPGLDCSEADRLARSIIEQSGFGDYFGHGLGHGIGLETHEEPFLNPRSKSTLEEDMVVTVEPGIYIPGWGGVRIEDMLLITEKGAESLTSCARDLIII